MKNNTENKDEMLRLLVERADKPSIPMSDRDREEAVALLNQRIAELQEEQKKIKEERKEKEESLQKIYEEMDSLDDDKGVCDKKIKELAEQIKEKGIDIEDSENLFVKRLKSVQEERDVIEEISAKRKEESEKLEQDIRHSQENDNELASQEKKFLATKLVLHNKMMQNKVEEEEKRSVKKAVDEVKPSSNIIAFLLDNLATPLSGAKMTYGNIQDTMRKEAEEREKVEVRHYQGGGERNETEGVVQDAQKPEDDRCYSLIVSNEGKTDVHIFSEEELHGFCAKKEMLDINDKIEQEAGLEADKKTVAVVITSHESREKLLEGLRSVVGDGVTNPQMIGGYASSPQRKERLLNAIHNDSYSFEKVGGGQLDAVFNEKKQPAVGKDAIRAQEIQDTTEVSKTNQLSADDLPWKQLRKAFNLSRKSLSAENIEKILKTGMSGLITMMKGRSRNKEEDISFKLMLSKDKDGGFKFVRLMKNSEDNINKREKLGDIAFSKEDKDMLKKYGQLNRLVPFTKDGKTQMMLVGFDKETNILYTVNPKNVEIPKFVKEQCTQDELKSLYDGRPVHMSNLKDSAGQKFNGWVVLSPKGNGQLLHLTHVDKDFLTQVRNNNYGERTTLLDEDKDAKVKTKQRVTNDAEDLPSNRRKAYDFSQSQQGTIQHEKTFVKTLK